MNTISYIFTSERLGFRNWEPKDISFMAEINKDPKVMEFFPALQSKEETEAFILRMQKQFHEKRFCYFAVEILKTKEFIGFTGLSEPTFEADFMPCIDIGWRLASKHWNQGYATEGAKRSLEYGFTELQLKKINAIAPKINSRSEAVMKKIGMNKIREFKHPKLVHDKRLEECILYEILK